MFPSLPYAAEMGGRAPASHPSTRFRARNTPRLSRHSTPSPTKTPVYTRTYCPTRLRLFSGRQSPGQARLSPLILGGVDQTRPSKAGVRGKGARIRLEACGRRPTSAIKWKARSLRVDRQATQLLSMTQTGTISGSLFACWARARLALLGTGHGGVFLKLELAEARKEHPSFP